MRIRKKHRSLKRNQVKHTRSRGASQDHRTTPLLREGEAVNQEIERLAILLVNQTTGPDGESDWWPENDNDWLAYFEQRVQELEEIQEEMQTIPDKEIRRSLRRRGIEWERRQRVEQLVAAIRRICKQELDEARIGLDAQKLRMALREEVCVLCSQVSSQTTRFIPIPPKVRTEDLPKDNEKTLYDVTMAYCIEIWFMMADTYPENCPVHLYLECPGGWFSAEVYESEGEAEQEAKRRQQSGEGMFEVQYFEECDSVVLFTKQQPRVVAEAAPESLGE